MRVINDAVRLEFSLCFFLSIYHGNNGNDTVTIVTPNPTRDTCMAREELRNPENIRRALDQGVDATICQQTCAPLHVLAKDGAYRGIELSLDLIVAENVNLDATDQRLRRPLHYAVEQRNYAVARRLAFYGVDLDAVDIDGKTPLLFAVEGNFLDMVKLLVEMGADVRKKDNCDNTAICAATIRNRKNIMKWLVEKGVEVNGTCTNGLTPLHWATANVKPKNMALLVANGADVNAIALTSDETLRTPLDRLLSANCDDPFGTFLLKKRRALALLVSHGLVIPERSAMPTLCLFSRRLCNFYKTLNNYDVTIDGFELYWQKGIWAYKHWRNMPEIMGSVSDKFWSYVKNHIYVEFLMMKQFYFSYVKEPFASTSSMNMFLERLFLPTERSLRVLKKKYERSLTYSKLKNQPLRLYCDRIFQSLAVTGALLINDGGNITEKEILRVLTNENLFKRCIKYLDEGNLCQLIH